MKAVVSSAAHGVAKSAAFAKTSKSVKTDNAPALPIAGPIAVDKTMGAAIFVNAKIVGMAALTPENYATEIVRKTATTIIPAPSTPSLVMSKIVMLNASTQP